MNNHRPDKLAQSYPDLEPLIDSKSFTKVKKNTYREIRKQLAVVRHSNLQIEHEQLRSQVMMLMQEEGKFQDRSKSNRSFWALEHPNQRVEIGRLKAKANQLEKVLKQFQKKISLFSQ